MRPRTLLLLAAATLALAACGKQGKLVQPDGPVWGSKSNPPPPPVNVEKKPDKPDIPERPTPPATSTPTP